MPIIKSAKKRVRTASKAAARNRQVKRALRSSLKDFRGATTGSDKKKVFSAQSSVQSNLDKAVKKNILHKNKAARLKKRLAAQAKAAGAKPVKTATKAAPAKKAPAKKSAAKKPAAKKTTAKK